MITDEIAQLLISMIVKYDDYGDKIGYTKVDLDALIEEYGLLKPIDIKYNYNNFNELGAIILHENGYISNEVFAEQMGIEYGDDKFYIVTDSFEDLLSDDLEYEASWLDGKGWENWDPSFYSDYDIDFSDFTKGTLEKIIEYCEEQDCFIEDEEEIRITKENTKIVEFKSWNDNIKYKVIINDDIDISDHIDDDGMEELKQNIQFGISDAYDSAQQDEVYSEIKSNFEDKIGTWKFKTITDKNGKQEERIHIYFNAEFSDIKSELKEEYSYYADVHGNGSVGYNYTESNYGDLFSILHEYEYLDMDKPNYQYIDGYPDSKLIDLSVSERF